MPFTKIPAAVVALTADGTTTGTVTVAATVVLLPGTRVNLYSAAAGSLECIVVAADILGVVSLRPVALTQNDHKQLNYGLAGQTLAGWKLADSAVLMIEAQIVPVLDLYRPGVV